jgi:tetratricopeptide (TPR) repeat protein
MIATVIELRTRRVLAADPAVQVRAARGSMTREAFAAALSPLLSRPAKPGMVRAWESGVPVPREVIEACQTKCLRTDTPAALDPPSAPACAEPGDALGPAGDDAIVIPCRARDGRIIWVSVPRRTFLSGGLGAAALTALTAAAGSGPSRAAGVKNLRTAAAGRGGLTPVEHLQQLRRVLVDSDNLLGSGSVIAAARAQIDVIQQLRGGRRGADHRALVTLQAQYAEFAGWLYQDAHDFRSAQFWLDRALEWSHIAADRELSTYVMARKSQLAGDMSDPAGAVDLADAAVGMARRRTRLKATAATYGAHGHALAGQRTACLRAIDRAREAAGHLDNDPESPWASWLDSSYIEVQRGRCLAVLGDHAQAAGVFQQAIRDLPQSFRRDRGVYLAREALAHAGARDPEQAAGVGMQALGIAADTQSGRIIDELGRVDSGLAPWAALPAVADFRDALTSVVPSERN